MTPAAVSEAFLQVAAQIEQRDKQQAVEKLLKQLHLDCQKLSEATQSKEIQSSTAQVQQALETWLQVWPRLSSQDDFRLAVAREARLWSGRFTKMEDAWNRQ